MLISPICRLKKDNSAGNASAGATILVVMMLISLIWCKNIAVDEVVQVGCASAGATLEYHCL